MSETRPFDPSAQREKTELGVKRAGQNFLRLSSSYTEVPTLQMDVVAAELTDSFEFGNRRERDVYEAVVEKLKDKNVSITLQEFQACRKLLMRVYKWLIASNNDEKKLAYSSATTSEKKVIDCFEKDGITIQDLNRISSLPVSPVGELIREKEDEDGGDPELVKANENLWEKVGELEKEGALLEGRVRELEERNLALQNRVRELEEENLALVGELDEAEGNSGKNEDAKEAPARANSKEVEKERMLGLLPKTFTWRNESGNVVYNSNFLKAFSDLSARHQRAAVKQVNFLCSQGQDYNSLKSQPEKIKITNTPDGSYSSRITDEVRFTWKKEKNGPVTFFWIFKKGDSVIRQSER